MKLQKASIENLPFVVFPGYGGKYRVYKHGHVYSEKSKRLLKRDRKPNGYFTVHLTENNITKKYYIHRVIATCYIVNEYNKPCINHLDGNKANNKVDNLQWCTHTENNRHAYAMGLNPNRFGQLNRK
jgi:hypothetical protein